MVRTVPAINFETLVKDSHKTAFAYIGLISGCVFQTIFYNEFDEENKTINSCLGLTDNCAGRGDLNKFNGIGTEHRKKYGNRENFTMYINQDLLEIYQDVLAPKKNFLNQRNALAIRERDIILQEFNDAENKDDFYHHNDADSIQNLLYQVREILQNTGIYETIYILKEQVCEAIEEDIKNGGKT